MADIIPGVTFQKIPSPNSLILPAGIANVAFTGICKTTKTTVENLVLPLLGLTGPTAGYQILGSTGVASITSVIGSDGVEYVQDAGISGMTGDYEGITGSGACYINWYVQRGDTATGFTGGARPSTGDSYTITYERNKIDSDYSYKTFYNVPQVVSEYGPASLTNTISLAAKFFFSPLNGGVGTGGTVLNAVQMTDNTMQAYQDVLGKLAATEIDLIVPLIPRDATTFAQLHSVTRSHVITMSSVSEGKNRIAFVADDNTTDVATYILHGDALDSERMVLTAPPTVGAMVLPTDDSLAEVDTQINSVYLNAAMAGFLANPDTAISQPLTRQSLPGFTTIGKTYLKSEISALLSNGILVVEQPFGADVRVVHGRTTDPSTVENSEITIVRLGDFFGKSLKTVLETKYIGGRVDGPTLASIRSTINSFADNFIANDSIISISGLSVTQDLLNPTKVNVALKIHPVYPLNFIDIKFSIGI